MIEDHCTAGYPIVSDATMYLYLLCCKAVTLLCAGRLACLHFSLLEEGLHKLHAALRRFIEASRRLMKLKCPIQSWSDLRFCTEGRKFFNQFNGMGNIAGFCSCTKEKCEILRIFSVQQDNLSAIYCSISVRSTLADRFSPSMPCTVSREADSCSEEGKDQLDRRALL